MSEWLNPYEFAEDNEQRKLHIGRYRWAATMIHGLAVANAACSCNYGAEILMGKPQVPGRLVVGFDRNPEGLALARKVFPEYEVREQDIQDESFEGFTSLVCLETFEHLKEPWKFLDGLAASVTEIVLSVPVIPTKHFNEWHLHDFTMDEMREGLKKRGWKLKSEATQDESNLQKPTYGLFYATR